MAALQIDIMGIKQLLLLKSKSKSNRKIALVIGVDRNTVNQYVRKLQSSGRSFDELLRLDELALQKLFPSKEALDGNRYAVLHGLFPGFVNELKKPGCTRQHLWMKLNFQNFRVTIYHYSKSCKMHNY